MKKINSTLITFVILLTIFQISLAYKPIIGIFGNANPEKDINKMDSDFVDGEYARWFQNMGADVIAIHGWLSESELDSLLSKINGVLFQGGDRDLTRTAVWEKRALQILEYGIKNQLPIWGTCQGFQMIAFLLTENDTVLEHYKGDWGRIHPSIATEEAKTSVLFKYFTEEDYNTYNTKDSAIYFHNLGLGDDGYNYSKRMKDIIRITSYATDVENKKFVASYEGKNSSIKVFGTQYHLEKIYYMRELGFEKMEPNLDCYAISYKILYAFMEEVYANKNRMTDEERKKLDFVNHYEFKEGKNYKTNFRMYFYKNKKNKMKTSTKIIIAVSCSVVGIGIIVGVVIFLLYAKKKDSVNPNDVEPLNQNKN